MISSTLLPATKLADMLKAGLGKPYERLADLLIRYAKGIPQEEAKSHRNGITMVSPLLTDGKPGLVFSNDEVLCCCYSECHVLQEYISDVVLILRKDGAMPFVLKKKINYVSPDDYLDKKNAAGSNKARSIVKRAFFLKDLDKIKEMVKSAARG